MVGEGTDGGLQRAPDHLAGAVFLNVRRLASRPTGIEVYIERLFTGLQEAGEVRVEGLTCVTLPSPELTGLVSQVRDYGVLAPDHLLSQLKKLYFDHWACLPRWRNRREPLLFHGVDGVLPRSLRRGDHAVVTVFDLGHEIFPEMFGLRTRLLHRASQGYTIRRADRILAISKRTADDLIAIMGVPAAKIEVVPLGVDAEFFEEVATRESGFGEPYFLAVGGVSPRKNSLRLLEAFRRWKASSPARGRYRLVITGTSRYSLSDPRVRERFGPDVELVGHVDTNRLKELYRGATALLYPSLYEGFGLPILEAMACGTPVLTSTTGAAPEVAGEAAILVDPLDTVSIVEGISTISQESERSRLRVMGMERALQFTWKKCIDGTTAVYRSVAF
jgi:glycosyltransferase involved in cell wall biosynthesis